MEVGFANSMNIILCMIEDILETFIFSKYFSNYAANMQQFLKKNTSNIFTLNKGL